jgi:hypothetical protein
MSQTNLLLGKSSKPKGMSRVIAHGGVSVIEFADNPDAQLPASICNCSILCGSYGFSLCRFNFPLAQNRPKSSLGRYSGFIKIGASRTSKNALTISKIQMTTRYMFLLLI